MGGVPPFTTALPLAADAGGSAATGGPGPAAGGSTAAAAAGTDKQATKKRSQTNAIIFGLINAIVGIPTMISFAAIVYQDAVYGPLLGQLARFSFFSAAMHQLAFTVFSTLPFAVGQPQDVGLIFLSAMATDVAEIGREQQLGEDVIVGTALLTLTLATLLVGLLTWTTGGECVHPACTAQHGQHVAGAAHSMLSMHSSYSRQRVAWCG